MRRLIAITLCGIMMLCTGCSSSGVSQEEYDKVVQERDTLAAAIDEYGDAVEIPDLSKAILEGSSSGLDSEGDLSEKMQPAIPIPVQKYEIGETASTKKFNVTLVDFFTLKRVNESKYLYFSADDGFTYGIVVFEIENKTAEAETIWPASDFKYYADNSLVDCSLLGYTPPTINGYAAIESQTELASGRKIKGYVVADIPDNTKELEIEYDGATFLCVVNAE